MERNNCTIPYARIIKKRQATRSEKYQSECVREEEERERESERERETERERERERERQRYIDIYLSAYI